MADSEYSSDLERRAAAAIREIPESKIHLFCASCAERFFEGYAAWLAQETLMDERAASLPSAEFVRHATDFCWNEPADPPGAETLLAELKRMMPGEHEQPIFKSQLDDYFEDLHLVQLGLLSVRSPQLSYGLAASAAALDFYSQQLDRRRDLAGIGPAWDDPERDLREFASDPAAQAECAAQIKDAEELRRASPDLRAMQIRSADHGRRVLEDVRRLIQNEPDRSPPSR